jgi:hypothetical protein
MTGSSAGSSSGGWMRIDDSWFKTNFNDLYDNFNASGPPAPIDSNSTPYNAGPGQYQSYNTVIWQGGNNGAITVATGYTNFGGTGSNLIFDSLGKFAYFGCYPNDGEMHGFRILLPSTSRGVRVTSLIQISLNGPDGAGWQETDANATGSNKTPTNAQCVSMGEGNQVYLGSNYTSYGIYFGDGSGTGKRLFYGNYSGPGGGGFSPNNDTAQWSYLTSSNFQPWDDIGSNADRIIWYETDGTPPERSYVYRFTFWIK